VASSGSIEAVVGSSEVPLAAVDLPSGRLLALNRPLALALNSSVDELNGTSCLDLLPPADRPNAQAALEALAVGSLTGYQAIREYIQGGDESDIARFSVWVSAVVIADKKVGLVSVIPITSRDRQFGLLAPLAQVPRAGDVVLGTVDAIWRIDRISQDVTALLGVTPEECAGAPVLGVVHPSDAAAFLAGVEHARRGERAVRLLLRLRGHPAEWIETTVVLATLSPGEPPPLAFALMRQSDDATPPPTGNRGAQLEAHMLRIAEELRAAGLVPRLDRLPDLESVPALSTLTSREWEVVTRLLEGERTPAIAADLFVSQSSIRNHLSAIYAKLGVHSQTELIRMLRQKD
jgi:DNA-binding CsgD family transcriptional regulator